MRATSSALAFDSLLQRDSFAPPVATLSSGNTGLHASSPSKHRHSHVSTYLDRMDSPSQSDGNPLPLSLSRTSLNDYHLTSSFSNSSSSPGLSKPESPAVMVSNLLDRVNAAAVDARKEALSKAEAQSKAKDQEIERLRSALSALDVECQRLRTRVQAQGQVETELQMLRSDAQRALQSLASPLHREEMAQVKAKADVADEMARLREQLHASENDRSKLASLLQVSRFDYDRLASVSTATEATARGSAVQLRDVQARLADSEAQRARERSFLDEALQHMRQERDMYKREADSLPLVRAAAVEGVQAAKRETGEVRTALANAHARSKEAEAECSNLRDKLRASAEQMQALKEDGLRLGREAEATSGTMEELKASSAKVVANSYAATQEVMKERDRAVAMCEQLRLQVQQQSEAMSLTGVLQRQAQELQAQVEEARQALQQSMAEAKELRGVVMVRDATIATLSAQIEDLKRKLAASDETATPILREPLIRHQAVITDEADSLSFPTVDAFLLHLKRIGLRSAQLVIGVDCTKSNLWSGKVCHHGRSLHDVSDPHIPTPYEKIIGIFGRALRDFDDDGMIPLYGFGCSRTQEHSVFSFKPGEEACAGIENAIDVYRTVIPTVTLAGPTSFAPLIKKTVEIVKKERQFTVLLIIADGQVTAVKETEAAIVEASKYPIAIITVGVGDGPWEEMCRFDDGLPHRKVDNFQFIDFVQVQSRATEAQRDLDTYFTLSALAELPSLIKDMKKLRMLPDK